ncbi:hypothetical protein SAY87_008259 [Trapa incisa]|uniref:AAA+ ATPase domain-containing protein n=1 Tax=Trapa incisa TaxID=236973 RepID=A0AAN7KHX5_9MYRT|nr:hypothetical protein SAY87_008259 [Trapa incisa]
MDGRRHSVDVPISKALIALRRVRSLRDPSTNSMSKFTALFENVNWDINSCNGISLQFVEDLRRGSFLEDGQPGHEIEDKSLPQLDGHSGLRKHDLISCVDPMIKLVEEKDFLQKKPDGFLKFLSKPYIPNHMEDGLDSSRPCTNHLEDTDSFSAPIATSLLLENVNHRPKMPRSYQINLRRASRPVADLSSCVGTPKLSTTDAFPEVSSQNTSLLFADEELDSDHRHFGRKIGCCWSRTPKLKGSKHFYSHFENNPIFIRYEDETKRFALRDSRKLYDVDNAPYSASPRSLDQKYRPKSFKDLVGQNVVARSLLGALSTGRLSSFYLFHGPRGSGKTSASRIFAAALNCLALEERGPCGICRECVVLYSGRNRDVREVDCVRLNHSDAVRSLIKSASIPPVSSRFSVFIMDECQLIHEETWAVISSGLENISRHSVFIMITPDLDRLPKTVLSRSQRYHFPKIKDADIVSKLRSICIMEGLDFDAVALDFIAAKSNGSLRDAEMMLDQLSLLGKRITTSMAYELVGIVSDDDLVDLLDLALSSDTSNTVIKARELMRSRVDPVQLTSQLASLIMDILSSSCEEHISEARHKFLRSHTSEADLHKLGHALKILSETEKQLRTSNNQATWLTAALLQLSTSDYASLNKHCLKICSGGVIEKDVRGDGCSKQYISGDCKKHFTSGSSDNDRKCCLRTRDDYRKVLDALWTRAAGLCKSKSLKSFLRKHGKLSSIGLNSGMVVAELEFENPHYVSRAEKSWKVIASSLQCIFGCNVEIRINLVPGPVLNKCSKAKKTSFNFFFCSRRMDQKKRANSERGSDSNCSSYTTEKRMMGDIPNLGCSSECGPQKLHVDRHLRGASSSLRNGDGNVLAMDNGQSLRSSHDCKQQFTGLWVDCSEEELKYWRHQVLKVQEMGIQFKCCWEPSCREKPNVLET